VVCANCGAEGSVGTPCPKCGDVIELPAAAFAPPRSPPVVLEVDPAWVTEKADKAAQHAARQSAKRPLKIGGVVAAVIAIAVVTVVAVKIATTKTAKPAPVTETIATPHTVSISVHSTLPASVTLDGKPVGDTPLTFYVPKGTHAITIGAGLTQRSIIPDRDQTVDF
jgi:hypothetical protein